MFDKKRLFMVRSREKMVFWARSNPFCPIKVFSLGKYFQAFLMTETSGLYEISHSWPKLVTFFFLLSKELCLGRFPHFRSFFDLVCKERKIMSQPSDLKTYIMFFPLSDHSLSLLSQKKKTISFSLVLAVRFWVTVIRKSCTFYFVMCKVPSLFWIKTSACKSS